MPTRRTFLIGAAAASSAFAAERGIVFPSEVKRYADPATEFPVSLLTGPKFESFLPPYWNRAVTRRSHGLLYSSERTGSLQAFRMDLKTGESRQLTNARNLNAASLSWLPDERGCVYHDSEAIRVVQAANLRTTELYRFPDSFEATPGLGVGDGGALAWVETTGPRSRLRVLSGMRAAAKTVAEADEALSQPVWRPGARSLLYRLGGREWRLVNVDGSGNRALRVAPGRVGPVNWSQDGASLFYLSFPESGKALNQIRSFTPESNEDRLVAVTSQFVHFARNADSSVFAGASGSKASPYILLLVRSVKREFTVCEHRASNPAEVAPIFSPNSQRIFFQSDRHGRMAIYSIAVDRIVEETEPSPPE